MEQRRGRLNVAMSFFSKEQNTGDTTGTGKMQVTATPNAAQQSCFFFSVVLEMGRGGGGGKNNEVTTEGQVEQGQETEVNEQLRKDGERLRRESEHGGREKRECARGAEVG